MHNFLSIQPTGNLAVDREHLTLAWNCHNNIADILSNLYKEASASLNHYISRESSEFGRQVWRAAIVVESPPMGNLLTLDSNIITHILGYQQDPSCIVPESFSMKQNGDLQLKNTRSSILQFAKYAQQRNRWRGYLNSNRSRIEAEGLTTLDDID